MYQTISFTWWKLACIERGYRVRKQTTTKKLTHYIAIKEGTIMGYFNQVNDGVGSEGAIKLSAIVDVVTDCYH